MKADAAFDANPQNATFIDSGTLLLFDEYEQWCGDNNRGERRALREWLAANPQFEVELYRRYTWGAAAFMVHRVA